jgi:hypothetical protein
MDGAHAVHFDAEIILGLLANPLPFGVDKIFL